MALFSLFFIEYRFVSIIDYFFTTGIYFQPTLRLELLIIVGIILYFSYIEYRFVSIIFFTIHFQPWL